MDHKDRYKDCVNLLDELIFELKYNSVKCVSYCSDVIDELIECRSVSKSARLFCEPLRLVEYFSRVTLRLVLKSFSILLMTAH